VGHLNPWLFTLLILHFLLMQGLQLMYALHVVQHNYF